MLTPRVQGQQEKEIRKKYAYELLAKTPQAAYNVSHTECIPLLQKKTTSEGYYKTKREESWIQDT